MRYRRDMRSLSFALYHTRTPQTCSSTYRIRYKQGISPGYNKQLLLISSYTACLHHTALIPTIHYYYYYYYVLGR